MPGTTVVDEKPGSGYLYAQCQTRWLKFTDDLKLALDKSAASSMCVQPAASGAVTWA